MIEGGWEESLRARGLSLTFLTLYFSDSLGVNLLGHDAEDVGLADDEEVSAVNFDFGAAVFGDENDIAFLDVEFDEFAIVVTTTSAEFDDLSLLWLFLGGVRQEQTSGCLLFCFDSFDEHACS